MTISDLISYYRRGAYTSRELMFKAVQLVTPQTVDQILSMMPRECLDELRTWASNPATGNTVLLAGNVTPHEAQMIEEQLASALPLLVEWFSTEEKK